jgi:hypothetical protein
LIKKHYISIIILCAFNALNAQNYWEAVGLKPNRFITDLYNDTSSNLLYIAGEFSYIDNVLARGVITWDGVGIDTLQCGIDINQSGGFPSPIFSIEKYNNKLYFGGSYSVAGNINSPFIASWDGTNWDSLPKRFNGAVTCLFEYNNELFACGAFTQIGNDTINKIAKFDGVNWTTVGNNQTWSNSIKCLSFYKGELYIAGGFSDPPNGIYNIAKWNGSNWVSPGSGIQGFLGNVRDMIVFNDELYVGGLFYKNDGNAGNSIMKWDSIQWTDVGGGMSGIYPTIYDLTINNGSLYACGNFLKAGGVDAKGIAKWDGINWCGLGGTFDNTIGKMVFYNDTLYVGGGFWTIDGDSVNFIAKWTGGNYVDTCGHIVSGINEITNQNDFAIYPNPATSTITIESKTHQLQSVKILDVLGREVYYLQTQNNKTEIDVSQLPSGIYIFQVQSKNGVSSKKVIKE